MIYVLVLFKLLISTCHIPNPKAISQKLSSPLQNETERSSSNPSLFIYSFYFFFLRKEPFLQHRLRPPHRAERTGRTLDQRISPPPKGEALSNAPPNACPCRSSLHVLR